MTASPQPPAPSPCAVDVANRRRRDRRAGGRLRAVAPGVSFVVLERAARAGGVIFSEQVDGFTIDGGPDALSDSEAGSDRAVPREDSDSAIAWFPPGCPRIAYIQRGWAAARAAGGVGARHPDRASARSCGPRSSSGPARSRMGAELFVSPKRDDADESIGAFMTRRFGAEAATYLAEPLLAGIHAGDVDRLSVRALFPRLVDAERTHGSLLRAFAIKNPIPNPISNEGHSSLYPMA